MINVSLAIPTTPHPLIPSPTLLNERMDESTHVLPCSTLLSPLRQLPSPAKHFATPTRAKQIAPKERGDAWPTRSYVLDATPGSSQSISGFAPCIRSSFVQATMTSHTRTIQ